MMPAMVISAQNNDGDYPLPGKLDPDNKTLAGDPESKNTTGNILSYLVFNGNISSDLCVSPAESNTTQVMRHANYEFTAPKSAATPADALWDPTFRGTPLDAPVGDAKPDAPGNQSYAHLVPIGARRAMWRDAYKTTQPAFGNRGPTYAEGDSGSHPTGRWSLVKGALGDRSNTLLIHGGRSTWEGYIAYNDGSVRFEVGPAPEGVAYTRVGAKKDQPTPDNLFVNESDEEGGDAAGSCLKGRNAYLGPVARIDAAGTPTLWRD